MKIIVITIPTDLVTNLQKQSNFQQVGGLLRSFKG